MKLSEITIEMVQKSLSGSTKATNDIYKSVLRYTMHYVCKRLTREDKHSQEDVAQDITIKIVMNLEKFRPDNKFSIWSHAVIKNHIIDFARKRKLDTFSIQGIFENDEDFENETFQIEDKSALTQDDLINNMETKKFVHALFKSELFSNKQKMVMKLRFIDDKTYEQVAEETGLKLNTIKGLIHRVRETVKGNIQLKTESLRLLSK